MVSLHIAQVSNLGKLVYRKLCHLATSITEFEMESQTSCGKTLPFGDNLLRNLALVWGSWRAWKRSAKSQTVTGGHPATRIPRRKPRGRKNHVGSAHLVSRPGRVSGRLTRRPPEAPHVAPGESGRGWASGSAALADLVPQHLRAGAAVPVQKGRFPRSFQ